MRSYVRQFARYFFASLPLVLGLTGLWVANLLSSLAKKLGDSRVVAGKAEHFDQGLNSTTVSVSLQDNFGNENLPKEALTPFSFHGRLNRTQFIFTHLSAIILSLVLSLVGWGLSESSSEFLQSLGVILIFLSIVGLVTVSWAASAKRMRDIGPSVYWVLLLLVPPLNLACAVFLLIVPSDEFPQKQK